MSKRIGTIRGVIQREYATSSSSPISIDASSASSLTAHARKPASPSPSASSTAPPGKTHTPGMNRASGFRLPEQQLDAAVGVLAAAPHQDHRRGGAGGGRSLVPRAERLAARLGNRDLATLLVSTLHDASLFSEAAAGASWLVVERALAPAAAQALGGEPDGRGDQGQGDDRGEGDEDGAGDVREDAEGVVGGVAERPAVRVAVAGDRDADRREVGALLQLGELGADGAQGGAGRARGRP